MRGSVTVHMAATPERIWELVSDVTRIGEYSPETFEAEWLDGAAGPAVGARFRGHVRRNGRGPVYWTTCEVVACEPGRAFGFGVFTGDKHTSIWRYVLEPTDSGTDSGAGTDSDSTTGAGCDVTESFELLDVFWLRLYWKILGWSRAKTNTNGMRTTLERIKAVAEAEAD